MDRKALKTGMLIVHDPKTHIEFMVDSGSRRSVDPCHRPATHSSVTGFMSCLNRSEVPTFECVELELTMNLDRSFTWTFVQADVLSATLGLDCRNHFGLLVDARRGRLVLPDENPVKPLYVFGDTRSSEAVAGTPPEIDFLRHLFAMIVRSRPFRTPRSCAIDTPTFSIQRILRNRCGIRPSILLTPGDLLPVKECDACRRRSCKFYKWSCRI